MKYLVYRLTERIVHDFLQALSKSLVITVVSVIIIVSNYCFPWVHPSHADSSPRLCLYYLLLNVRQGSCLSLNRVTAAVESSCPLPSCCQSGVREAPRNKCFLLSLQCSTQPITGTGPACWRWSPDATSPCFRFLYRRMGCSLGAP